MWEPPVLCPLWLHHPVYVVEQLVSQAQTQTHPGERPAMDNHTRWERQRFLLNCSLFQLVDTHECLALTDPRMSDWISSLSELDRLVIEYDGGLTQFLSRHPVLEVLDNYIYLTVSKGRMRTSQLFVPPNNNVPMISEAQECYSDAPHPFQRLNNWVVYSDGERSLIQPACNRSSHAPQQHLQEGVSQLREPLYLEGNSPHAQKADQHLLFQGGTLHEMDSSGCSAAEHPGPTAQPGSFEDCEPEGCKGAQKPELKCQSVSTWKEFIPSQLKTKMAEDEALAVSTDKAAALLCSEDQSLNCHSIMEEDESIIDYVKEDNSQVGSSKSGQSQAAGGSSCSSSPVPCDTTRGAVAEAELPQCTSRFIQTEGLGRSDKTVNTELLMADLDFITEDFIQMAKKELTDKQETVNRPESPAVNMAHVLKTLEPGESQTRDEHQKLDETAAGKELCASEVWYDAVGTLDSADAAEMGRDKDHAPTPVSKEAKSSAWDSRLALQTVDEAMKWLRTHQPSGGTAAPFTSDSRVAKVTSGGPQSAASQGHTSCMQHINRAISGSPSQAPACPPKTEPSSTENLPSSVSSKIVVSNSPTAQGTYLPQHYGTMGSLDTLMAELRLRHPGVVRQKILDALMEVKGEQRHSLSRLPLTTIADMTSQLLSRHAGTTQL